MIERVDLVVPPTDVLAQRQDHNMQAELDIFSGRPNPIWTLQPDVVAELEARIATLPLASQTSAFDGMGYRGIVARDLNGQAKFREIRIGSGVVSVELDDGSRRDFQDDGQRTENWLLSTARGQVAQELLDTAASAIAARRR
jgi:hypothetical protein